MNKLIEISRFFKLFESIEELMPELKNLCEQNQLKVKKEKEFLNLAFPYPLQITKEVCSTIPLDKVNTDKVIACLCRSVNDLNKKVKILMAGEISEEQLEENLKSKDILKYEDEKKMVINWILQTMKSKDKKVNMTLLYKLTIDGDSAYTFHNKCNNKGPTLTLVRNTKGYRCGGFTNQSWANRYNSNGYGSPDVNDPDAFLFSLEFKEKYPSYDGTYAIYDYQCYGPTFGHDYDLLISDNCSQNNNSHCIFLIIIVELEQKL